MEKIVGVCQHYLHEGEGIDIGTFEYKGCWACLYFDWSENSPLISTKEAATQLGVSPATVKRWIRKGKLKGKLFERVRSGWNPPKKKYFVFRDGLEELLRRR